MEWILGTYNFEELIRGYSPPTLRDLGEWDDPLGCVQFSPLTPRIYTFGKLPSLKLTANAPENRPNAPKGNETSLPTIHFQGRSPVSFREGNGWNPKKWRFERWCSFFNWVIGRFQPLIFRGCVPTSNWGWFLDSPRFLPLFKNGEWLQTFIPNNTGEP